MLKNYFKIAWRNLVKQKQFTVLNLLGLSTGLACVLLIYLWVNDELHVDKFSTNDKQLYQVFKNNINADGSVETYSTTQGLLADEMKKSYPEVEHAVQVASHNELSILSFGDKHIKVKHEFAGKDFFNVFSYPIIHGSDVVSGVTGIFLSDKTAMKLFNTTDVVGKTVSWDFKDEDIDLSGPFAVAGVYTAPPANATNQFDVLFPFDYYAQKFAHTMGDVTFWGSNMVSTFVVVRHGTNIAAFNKKIKNFTIEKVKSLYPGNGLANYEGTLSAKRYSDGYLYNNYINGKDAGGRIEYVRLFSIIAIFILVIACINFMNLSTAKAAGRMKEVGVRKVVGASRIALVIQYMAESMLLSFFAMIIAIFIASLLLPVFRQITGKELSLHMDAYFIISVVTFSIITGIIAGSYPAVYLSGFKPVLILKGKLTASASESFIRKGLVVFQFTISVVLIITVIVVYEQMKLVQTKNLGYNKDNIIRFSSEGKLQDHQEVFVDEVKKIPGVVNASMMNGDFLGNSSHSGGGINWDGKDPNLNIGYFGVSGDYDFMNVLDIKMAEGRTFSREYPSDSLAVIFNESAIAAMGIKNPVGKIVSLWGHRKKIIGVAKDFHFQSLYKKVGPAFLEYLTPNPTVLVKLKAGMERETIARIEQFYKNFNQGLPLDYKFLDADYQAMYSSEEKVAVLSRYFATIAIIISCLGLFGLAAFTAQKRQKEIGIRKVVGASVNNITMMLSKDFLKLVLVAVLIAFPLAWWAMNAWLKNFAYRINMTAGIFLIAATTIIFITLVTVSYQAIKAALANPAKSLRTE
ncbi:MAG TPA: ABC transporter permease [Puia sp.]|nr:ABC transporter permease [Puia sp.]